MKNTYWFRHYLICSKMANDVLGLKTLNFAKLLLQQENGQFANSQMTVTFNKISDVLCDITSSERNALDDELDFGYISQISDFEMKTYYNDFCLSKIVIDNSNEK